MSVMHDTTGERGLYREKMDGPRDVSLYWICSSRISSCSSWQYPVATHTPMTSYNSTIPVGRTLLPLLKMDQAMTTTLLMRDTIPQPLLVRSPANRNNILLSFFSIYLELDQGKDRAKSLFSSSSNYNTVWSAITDNRSSDVQVQHKPTSK